MDHTTFFEHYRIQKNFDGSPQELGRAGAAINYKAVDTRSNEPVTLQLIPLASIDQTKRDQFEERARTAQKLDHVNIAKVLTVGVEHDHLALVSEYLDGEPADSWIVVHGPMTADAVLRAGLQVVRAVGAAAFFGLTHRAIQPSNITIVPGESPDGGWPFVKLLNFGLAGLEFHSQSDQARELAPTPSAQFASPEQLLNREIDFRSEMYSLGATLCFLLTGAVPLGVGEMKASSRLKRFPELRHQPKALRNLLARMLSEKPESRPQDPVAFEKEMRECLTKIEKRQAFRKKLGLPLAVAIPKKPREPREPSSPLAQVFRGVVAVAVLILVTAAIAELFFPNKIPFLHSGENIGVPVGVPNAQSFASAPVQTATAGPITTRQPIANPSPTVAKTTEPSSSDTFAAIAANTQPSAVTSSASPSSSTQTASAQRTAEPPPPAAGPDEQSAPTENSDQSSSTSSSESNERKKRNTASNQTWTPRDNRLARPYSPEERYGRGALNPRRLRSRVIGHTPDGRMILRLPSGRVIIVTPRYDEDVIGPRRRYIPPSQPYYPPGYPYND